MGSLACSYQTPSNRPTRYKPWAFLFIQFCWNVKQQHKKQPRTTKGNKITTDAKSTNLLQLMVTSRVCSAGISVWQLCVHVPVVLSVHGFGPFRLLLNFYFKLVYWAVQLLLNSPLHTRHLCSLFILLHFLDHFHSHFIPSPPLFFFFYLLLLFLLIWPAFALCRSHYFKVPSLMH